ncbi:UNVERIFIED_CONTAM: hypothetical protein C7454_12125 [Acidovorax defluvii]|jgi:hypothetical protein
MAKPVPPLSLIQYFDVPDDYRSGFCWMCGYSADALFLNQAIERFTRETRAQRASRGALSVALMLDPGHPAICPVEVPGLVHLPIAQESARPFRLLHAKVALLGFRHASGDGRWRVRLVVSTGNWTRQTVEDSLDLVWSIDVASEDLETEDADVIQRRADFSAAWSLFAFLQAQFDLRILDATNRLPGVETQDSMHKLADWMEACAPKDGPPARFIDNRASSFLAQLPHAIHAVADSAPRNYLAMGSGFFEGGLPNRQLPAVLGKIVATLREHRALTGTANIDVFVNPAACQVVASALPAMNLQGWDVRAAASMAPLFGRHASRSLHAKFLFSASEKSGSNSCHRPWVYLGSGNLTGPGFDKKMSRDGGNLEAGVVFAPIGLSWYANADVAPETVITNLLPVHWDHSIDDIDQLSVGEGMPPHGPPFVAPPVAWVVWASTPEGGRLQPPAGTTATDFEILDPAEQPCYMDETGFSWSAAKPRQVLIRWTLEGAEHRCLIPVMDEFGRLAASALTALDFESAWWALENFPAVADGDDGPDDTGDTAPNDPKKPDSEAAPSAGAGGVSSYPVRQMMELVERIASRQTVVLQTDWPAWCARLEQTLARLEESPVLGYFRTLDLNPLSPLRVPAFRPAYAETGESAYGAMYESMLTRVDARWKTAELPALGGEP